MKEKETHTPNIGDIIDKSYQPVVGDILSTTLVDKYNKYHSLMLVENIYFLNRRSSIINKNYNNHLIKYEWLQKVIQRKEIIWGQHKNDVKLFPNKNDRFGQQYPDRSSMKYDIYCYYNYRKQYNRLYNSKYQHLPTKKVQVIIGEKMMLRISHHLCSCTGSWHGYSQATPLSSLVTKKSIYKGNIYRMLEYIK